MFLVIYPVMINLRIEELFHGLKKPKPLLFSLLINFTVSPALAYLIGSLFYGDQPQLFTALMILSFIPTGSMTAAWTSLTGGSLPTALIIIPGNLFFSALVAVPLILPPIIGRMVEVSPWTFMRSILLVFFIPMLLGMLTRSAIVRSAGEEKYRKVIKPELGGLSSAGIILLIFLIISLKRTSVLLDEPGLLIQIILPMVLYYGAMALISTGYMLLLVGKGLLTRGEGIVISYASMVRHLNITMAVILVTFPVEEAAAMLLLIIIGFIIQVPSVGFYAKKFGARFTAGG
jgi:ACR3 family arsenite transporter